MKDKYYESRFKFNPDRNRIWKEIARFHQKFVPAGGTVLDLGAGYCDFINNITAGKKYAVDTSSETPNYKAQDVEFLQKPASDLSPISNGSIDVIHASNLFEHFDDIELERVMREVKRVLKVGARLILMQPNYRLAYKNYFDDYTHKKVWSDASLGDFLVANDFKIILAMPKFLPFSMKSDSSLIPRALVPFIVRTYINSPIKPFAGQMLFVGEKR